SQYNVVQSTMNDLSGLTYDGETYRWLKTFEDLKCFINEALNIKGRWKSPGGDVKVFRSDGEGEFVIKWHGPRSKKLIIQSDNAEENLKSKLESLIDQGPSNVNISHEATDVICPSVPDVCVSIDELSVSQFANLKADFASLVDITSNLLSEVNSMRSKQKDFESVIRKQDDAICKLSEENLFLTSSLLSLESSIFNVMNNNYMFNNPKNSMKITISNDPETIDKDQSTDPNKNTSYTSGPFLLNESSTLDESVTIIKDQPSVSVSDQPSVSDIEVVDNRKSVEATKLDKSSKTKPTMDETNSNAPGSVTDHSNRAPSKYSKHLTPCPFLKKRGFCKKGPVCDSLHQKRLFHSDMQGLHHNSMGQPFPHQNSTNSNASGPVIDHSIRAPSKYPKHLTPCPFLKKRGFCKKGPACDFLHQKHQSHSNMQGPHHNSMGQAFPHQKRQSHNNMQRPFHNPMGQSPFLPAFRYSPFPVNPCYFPPFRIPTYHPTPQPSLYPPPLM
ncbi:---NA---, partial [Paramuricea clavata]